MSTQVTSASQVADQRSYVWEHSMKIETTTISTFANDLSVNYRNLTSLFFPWPEGVNGKISAYDKDGNLLGSVAANETNGTAVIPNGASATQLVAYLGSQQYKVQEANLVVFTPTKDEIWLLSSEFGMKQPERNQNSLIIRYVDGDEVSAKFFGTDINGRLMGQAKVDSAKGIVHLQLDASESPFYLIYCDEKQKVPFMKAILM